MHRPPQNFSHSVEIVHFSFTSLEKGMTYFKMKRQEKTDGTSGWGGARVGAGRQPGRTKKTICVSVNETIFNRAIKRWKKNASPLIEILLDLYASRRVSLKGTGQ